MVDVSSNDGATTRKADSGSSRRWLSWLLPNSMAGRLVVLLLAALVISQLAGLAFFFGERRQALQGVAVRNVLNRTAMVAGLVESTPADLHEAVLRASSSRELRFRISQQPLVEKGEQIPMARRFRDQLVEVIPGFQGDVRLRRAAVPGVSAWRRGEHEGRANRRMRDMPRGERRRERRRRWRRRLRWMQASVELGPNIWLNMRAATPNPGNRPLIPFLATLGLMALSVALVAAFAIRKITRPLQALGDAAEQVGRGEQIGQLPLSGPDELKTVTRAFNDMNERVTRFVQDRTRMLAAISHDLRTPITTMRLRAEMVEPPETRARMIATLDEMQRMTEETLTFVKNEAQSEPTRTTDLSALVSSVCSDLSEIGKPVTFEPAPRILARCRPTAITRAVRNLTENAVAHGVRAHVRVFEEKGSVVIQVDDEGPGLGDLDLDQVFEPFYRVEKSRNRETGGVGLGLAIARSVIRAHGGEVSLSNLPTRGLRAQITLPLN